MINSSRRRGFTLIELLVAITVLILLVGLLLQITQQASSAWISGQGNVDRRQNGRAILDSIRNELQAALLPVSSNTTNGLQFIINPPGISDDFRNADAAFWQAPIATDQRLGDVAVIGYFVKWDAAGTAKPRPSLCRLFINPVEEASSAPNPHFLVYMSPSNWITDTIIQAEAPANKANRYRGLFAEGVVGLWMRALAPDGNLITSTAAGAAYPPNSFDSREGYEWAGATRTQCLPASVEVSIVLIDTMTMSRLTGALHQEIVTEARKASSAEEFMQTIMNDERFNAVRQGMEAFEGLVHFGGGK